VIGNGTGGRLETMRTPTGRRRAPTTQPLRATEPLRVLLVEDSAADAELIVRALELALGPVQVARVEDADGMRGALAGRTWDVVLSDWTMPDFDVAAALDVLALMAPDLPLIIVTGSVGEEAAVAAMRAGARDLVLKHRLARLGPAVEREIREHRARAAAARIGAALRESQALNRGLLDANIVGVAQWKGDQLTEANDAFLSLLGRSSADLVEGRLRWSALTPAEHAPTDEEARGELRATGRCRPYETELYHQNGARVPVLVAAAADRLAAGAGITFVLDLRERNHALTRLKASEARFRRLFETRNEGFWILDADQRTVMANRRLTEMLGQSPAKMLGRSVTDFVDEQHRELLAPTRPRRASVPGERSEIPLRRADGTILVSMVEGTPLFDDQGRYEGAFATVLDVTEQRRAEQALRVSEARFARLSDSGIIGIAFADVNGNIHEANDAYFGMLGRTRDALVAGKMRWDDMTPPRWHEVDARAVAQLRATGIAQPWEKELLHADGRPVPVLVGVAMLDAANFIAFVADLTERKRAEEALRRSEEQLRQSQKLEAIGVLAGGVAHDFNNLMSVVLSYSSWLIEDLREGDPLRNDALEIQRAGERACALTRQLLAFSRRQVLQPEVLDLNEVVSGMEKMLRRLLGEDVALTSLADPEIPKVKVDAGQLEQVLMNLCVNSRDAMPKGGELTIETARVVLDEAFAQQHAGAGVGPHVRLTVSDNGCGMDAATRARIFEPFFTTKEQGKGTGLGLSTVLGIIQQSGGTIWVYSEPGQGTSFKIYLPATEGETAVATAASAPADRGSETVLLVEDDETVRALARAILRRNGYQVLDASGGGEALLICEQHSGPIHLLLTDVVMPRMSGRQLAERLNPLRPDMRVLYMSGYTDDAVVLHGVLEAHVAFLQKPITPQALLRKVRRVLD
jgi:PAS domain S-box-containing protein